MGVCLGDIIRKQGHFSCPRWSERFETVLIHVPKTSKFTTSWKFDKFASIRRGLRKHSVLSPVSHNISWTPDKHQIRLPEERISAIPKQSSGVAGVSKTRGSLPKGSKLLNWRHMTRRGQTFIVLRRYVNSSQPVGHVVLQSQRSPSLWEPSSGGWLSYPVIFTAGIHTTHEASQCPINGTCDVYKSSSYLQSSSLSKSDSLFRTTTPVVSSSRCSIVLCVFTSCCFTSFETNDLCKSSASESDLYRRRWKLYRYPLKLSAFVAGRVQWTFQFHWCWSASQHSFLVGQGARSSQFDLWE